MKAFEIEVNGKRFDYRVGSALDLSAVRTFFLRIYDEVDELRNAGRHVLGRLRKGSAVYFLKLATTEGISAVTRNEYLWNDVFSAAYPKGTSLFRVPHNVEDGLYASTLYYMITDVLEGTLLARGPEVGAEVPTIDAYFERIIGLSEAIADLPAPVGPGTVDHRQVFLEKVLSWYDAIPEPVKKAYAIRETLGIVEAGVSGLAKKPRHGDVAPWHLLDTGDALALIDGEHYLANGVELYDVGYFTQRLFSVLGNTAMAEKFCAMLVKKGYDPRKIRVILAARAIGGFLDASLAPQPRYDIHASFQEFFRRLG